MSGLPDIDITDWETNTEYTGYSADDCVIKVCVTCKASLWNPSLRTPLKYGHLLLSQLWQLRTNNHL